MRIPLTRYGMPQVWFYPALAVLVMIIWAYIPQPAWMKIVIELLLLAVLVWLLSFFRDPIRVSPIDKSVLLSPADGTVTDINYLDETSFIKGKTVRIGIFLSIFNVHINRMPCAARVESVTYKKGQFRDARAAVSSKVNESNDIGIVQLNSPGDRLLLRQISGAIARHIVCESCPGRAYTAGEQFGMIKFGSRTELYVPIRENISLKVEVGDKVRAGATILLKYNPEQAR